MARRDLHWRNRRTPESWTKEQHFRHQHGHQNTTVNSKLQLRSYPPTNHEEGYLVTTTSTNYSYYDYFFQENKKNKIMDRGGLNRADGGLNGHWNLTQTEIYPRWTSATYEERIVMNRGGLHGRANCCNSKGQEHSQLQEPEQPCCCGCVSNSTHGQGSPALALVIDGNESGVLQLWFFPPFIYVNESMKQWMRSNRFGECLIGDFFCYTWKKA